MAVTHNPFVTMLQANKGAHCWWSCSLPAAEQILIWF